MSVISVLVSINYLFSMHLEVLLVVDMRSDFFFFFFIKFWTFCVLYHEIVSYSKLLFQMTYLIYSNNGESHDSLLGLH